MKNTIKRDDEEYPRDPDYDYSKDFSEQAVSLQEVPDHLTPMDIAKDGFYNTPCSQLVALRKHAEATIVLCDLHEVPKD
jgi:hypothetical protein